MIWLNRWLQNVLSPLLAAQRDCSLRTLAVSPDCTAASCSTSVWCCFCGSCSEPACHWLHIGSMDFTFLLSTMQALCRQNLMVLSLIQIGGLPWRKDVMLSLINTPGILFCAPPPRPILPLTSQSFPQVHCWWYVMVARWWGIRGGIGWLELLVGVVRYCSCVGAVGRGYCPQGAGREPLPTAEQEGGGSLLILA